MKWPALLVIGVIAGVLLALLTGLINTTSNVVGAEWYGFPFTWLIKMMLAPQYYPWTIQYLQLVADLAVWILVSWAIIFVVVYCKKATTKKTPVRRRAKRKRK